MAYAAVPSMIRTTMIETCIEPDPDGAAQHAGR